MAETETRTAKPGALLSQWWTLGELLRDNRRARSHDAVLWVILDAHRAKTGHCPASVRYIKAKLAGSIVSSDTITKAIDDLEAWGYISRVPRLKRSAPTEFIPKWVCVPAQWDMKSCVPADQDTGVPEHQSTGVPSDRDESYLLSPADRPVTVGSKDVSAAPPADGLTATAAAAGFERIWVVYGKLGNKKASRAAFEAIENPDVELIVERAASWAASAKPGQRRMPLEKWLAQEKFDEADRKTKALENRPASPNTEKRGKPKVAPKPANGKRKSAGTLATIVDGSLDGEVLAVTFRRNDAAKSEATHRLHGRYIDQLAAAVGGLPDNFEDLIGARVHLDESDGDVAIEAPASWLRRTVQATNILGGRT